MLKGKNQAALGALLRRCKELGWRRPLRSARVGNDPRSGTPEGVRQPTDAKSFHTFHGVRNSGAFLPLLGRRARACGKLWIAKKRLVTALSRPLRLCQDGVPQKAKMEERSRQLIENKEQQVAGGVSPV